ncbi:MAG: GNAT family N-acetyltransferase [Candidatus Thorarchaeota archaeon]|jgi:GNAT superfamily N-acetyltransferase
MKEVLSESWGSSKVVSRGVLHQADRLPGLVAEDDGEREGLLTFNVKNNMLEIVTLNVFKQRKGIGRAFIDRVVDLASSCGCSRVWVITTNDNTQAIEFYKNMGFRTVTIHKEAIRESRKLKPEIPEFGVDGIPITDEIELEIILGE